MRSQRVRVKGWMRGVMRVMKAKAAEGLPEEMAPDQVSVAKAKTPAKAPAKRGRAKAAPKAEKPKKKGWWNRMMGE